MINYDVDETKKRYDDDGFVILRNCLGMSEVAALRERAVPLADRLFRAHGNHSTYRNVLKSLQRVDPWFEEQLNAGPHVPLIKHLLNDDVVGASAAWFDRPEGEVQGFKPHVDVIGSYREPDAGATIWFALDRADTKNGCLHYLRGSHKAGHRDGSFVHDIDHESADVFAAQLNPGDAIIHSALTVHWSGGNESGAPRRAVSYFYFSARSQANIHSGEQHK